MHNIHDGDRFIDGVYYPAIGIAVSIERNIGNTGKAYANTLIDTDCDNVFTIMRLFVTMESAIDYAYSFAD